MSFDFWGFIEWILNGFHFPNAGPAPAPMQQRTFVPSETLVAAPAAPVSRAIAPVTVTATVQTVTAVPLGVTIQGGGTMSQTMSTASRARTVNQAAGVGVSAMTGNGSVTATLPVYPLYPVIGAPNMKALGYDPNNLPPGVRAPVPIDHSGTPQWWLYDEGSPQNPFDSYLFGMMRGYHTEQRSLAPGQSDAFAFYVHPVAGAGTYMLYQTNDNNVTSTLTGMPAQDPVTQNGTFNVPNTTPVLCIITSKLNDPTQPGSYNLGFMKVA